jgi:uncharacterized Fe-S cluster protein YjdI
MDLKNISKKYSNGEITIVWKPGLCIHSTICWKGEGGLLSVFDPRVKPWIRMEGAGTLRIIDQVNLCPSGALSFFYNENEVPAEPSGHKKALTMERFFSTYLSNTTSISN